MLRNKRGSSVVISLGIIVLLSTLGTAMLTRGLNESQLGRRSAQRQSAFFLAEAAADHAIDNLRINNSADVATTTLLTGTYWAEVSSLGGSNYQVTAHGLNSSEQRNLEIVVQQTGKSVFQYPLFGDDAVLFKKGGFTDSYDSRLGAYDASTAGSNGNLATNSTTTSSIELKQNSVVNGQLIVGPGMTTPGDATDVDMTSIVTADPDAVSAPKEWSLPTVITTGMDCTSNLSLPKDTTFTFTEAGSPYCYNQISTDKNTVILVTGDVMVYADGVNFDKNLNVNADGKPTQFILQIYGTNDVVVDKDGTFVGGLYAPSAKVRLKKITDFYGAIAAKEVRVDKESSFHFDEALKDIDGPSGNTDVSVLSWREL